MGIRIALVGNPNSGKTTLFNKLTGSNQYVGNWPGVTVEKKEGKLKSNKDVIIVDLPGIYSLSPYTLEEVISRDYLVEERPDAILNIVDGTNLERNLYLTTQLTELGLPVVVAVNMADVMAKTGYMLNEEKLEKELNCKVVKISALNGDGVEDAAKLAIKAAEEKKIIPVRRYSGTVEHAIAHIEEYALHDLPNEQQRWYGIKLFERDPKIREKLNLSVDRLKHIEEDIDKAEEELDDDAESIITAERYEYIASMIDNCYIKKNAGKLTTSDKIDRVVTNRILALPIFVAVMFIVYYVSVTTIGTWATDWTNENLFGDGYFLFGKGAAAYEEVNSEYELAKNKVESFVTAAKEKGLDASEAKDLVAKAEVRDDEGNIEEVLDVNHSDYMEATKVEEPEHSDYGTWVPGIPPLVEGMLDKMGVSENLKGLVLDGIVAGVGAVLGFVPQMLVLFLFLAFLEGCGYMARIAFIMDRIFRKFGLSGKSFIPMLIGTGCSVPGIMASRTIESDRDRKMTIITTIFIPCGAKLPIIALIAGAMFGGAWWVAPSAYFIGVAAVIVSGIMLKKTFMFAGDPAPFVMELPSYHLPTVTYVLKSAWERGWSFIKKAGTIIMLATILVWATSNYGWQDGVFGKVDMNDSILANVGNAVAWIFTPLGFGNWQAAVATVTGLIAKENVVGTFGVLFGGFEEVAENGWQIWNNIRAVYTPLAAYSFLVFNLLCAPCFAAIGATKREMNSAKWTLFAVAYQTLFAYAVALIIYQIGLLFQGGGFTITTAIAFIVLAFLLYRLFKPAKTGEKLKPVKTV